MERDYKNIIVPVDGSKNAKLAFNRALKVAEDYHATLHIIHVIDTQKLDEVLSDDGDYVKKLTAYDKKYLDADTAKAKKAGVKADEELEYGSPRVMLAHQLVKKYQADLIIMGANGLSAMERILMGSVASYVSRVAPCDVLLVKQ